MDDNPDPGHGGKPPASGHLPRLESGPQAFDFIEEAPVAMAVLDRQMRYLAYSRRWAESHGLGDGDLRGRCHYELFGALPERWHHAHELALTGESVARAEDRIVHPDGRVQWLGWEVQPWYDGPGLPGGVMICTQDITDSKQTEHWLRESEARLRPGAAGRLVRQLRLTGGEGEDRWLHFHGQVTFAGEGVRRKAKRIRGMVL